MSEPAVDDVLGDLAEVAGESIADWRAAGNATLDVSDEPESAGVARVPPEPQDQSWPDPRRSFELMRLELDREATKAVARAFVAWWAYAATVAVIDTLTQTSVDRTRVIAGDPQHWIGDEARAHYESLTTDTSPIWVDAPDPDTRRNQLWGSDWIDSGAPRLATATELSELLRTYGAPADLVEEVRRAREAVAEAVAAAVGRPEHPVEVGSGPLRDRDLEQAEALADYARLLTSVLPAIRAIRDSGD